MMSLTEDEIDDILYFARTNSLSDLESTIQDLATQHSVPEVDICSAAVEEESRNSALHYAAANGHIEIVKYLLRISGALPLAETDTLPSSSSTREVPTIINARNGSGNTALHWAALNGHVDTILLLLSHGADPSLLNEAGHDALFEAEVNERGEAVEALLREGSGLEGVVNGGDGGEREDEDDEAEEEDETEKEESEDGVNGIVDKVQKLETGS